MAESCFDKTCRFPEILPFDLMKGMNGRIIHTNHAWILPFDLMTSKDGRIICTNHAWILPFDLITSMDGRIVKRSGGKAVPANSRRLSSK